MERLRGSVIIATWNACDVLERCLESLEAQHLPGGFETIVVDNASTDATAELLRAYAERLRVIPNDHNAGFSGANNQAAREARGEILFFLNPDTELLDTHVLDRLARAVEAPDVGIAGPMIVNPDGSLQSSCAAHPSIALALLIGTGLHRLLPDRLRARVAPQFWSHSHPIDTGWLMGAALAVRASVFRELGGFWLMMYGQDEDLAYRAQERGFRVRFDNSARVMHVGNHSAARRWSTAQRARQVAAAELALLRTHYPRHRAAAIRTITTAAYAARSVGHGLLGRGQPASAYRSMARVYASRSGPEVDGG